MRYKYRDKYYKRIEELRPYYELIAINIGKTIQKMQNESIIKAIKINGRIKSFESVLRNIFYKEVDDCFGLRIIGNSDDLELIKKQLEKILVIDEIRDHRENKTTQYNGVHLMVHIEGNPIKVEIQFWTPELEQECTGGKLAYSSYKQKDMTQLLRDLGTNEQTVLDGLPEYFEIQGGNIKHLSKEETLYKMYPELKELLQKTPPTPPNQEDFNLDI